MAADKDKGWALDSFYSYKEFRKQSSRSRRWPQQHSLDPDSTLTGFRSDSGRIRLTTNPICSTSQLLERIVLVP
ncbi:hypothetical protein SAY87_005208 [Trapa incisa]|uniref:Uncharacterized protein n=1 Tax=Trapa incisa TaxID=236973 RepID=A0AAN7KC05_9MYRT|nr:hypothetical protein SAY87_005208 [Trapa incisa]